ncbi:zona pellucida sperm-binding protein 3 receptor-like [Ciona intestinalis]
MPVNGTASPSVPASTGYDLGSTIRYTCTGTNNIIGSSINICQNDGSWRYTAIPVCSSVCYSAPTILNGDYMPKQIYANPGTSVYYNCISPSYQIRGSTQATCQATTLTWTSAPVCQRVCGNPPGITNGTYTMNGGNAFFEGAKVNYTCSKSFRLSAASSGSNPLNENSCLSSGSWQHTTPTDLPSCEPLCTSNPPSITVGSGIPTTSPPYAVGDTVAYNCTSPSPALLFGNTSNLCEVFETWKYPAPVCRQGYYILTT